MEFPLEELNCAVESTVWSTMVLTVVVTVLGDENELSVVIAEPY